MIFENKCTSLIFTVHDTLDADFFRLDLLIPNSV